MTATAISEDNAVLLLAAAQELGLPPEVVRVKGSALTAPDEVFNTAFGDRPDEKE